jgi:hypothetical protein
LKKHFISKKVRLITAGLTTKQREDKKFFDTFEKKIRLRRIGQNTAGSLRSSTDRHLIVS